MRGGTVWILLVIEKIACQQLGEFAGAEDGVSRVIQEKAKEILDDENFKMSSLPVHSRFTRNASCPGVTEDVIEYRLDVPRGDGSISPLIVSQTVLNDHSQQTLIIQNPQKPWITGDVFVRPYLNCFSQENEQLVDIIKNEYLVHQDGSEYNFSLPVGQMDEKNVRGEVGQPVEVDELVYGGNLKNGFFIEAGAHEFETHSDSLYFELNHNWQGLLIEPHPLAFAEGLEKHRKATGIQTCLSTSQNPETMNFDLMGSVRNASSREAMAGLVLEPNPDTVKMQCLPLYSILLALGNPTVHYFSLDIEGAEFPVLKTIPWDKVDIRVLSVETHLAGRVFPGDRQGIIQFMQSVGYQHITWGHTGQNEIRTTLGTIDDMFVKNGVPVRRKDEL